MRPGTAVSTAAKIVLASAHGTGSNCQMHDAVSVWGVLGCRAPWHDGLKYRTTNLMHCVIADSTTRFCHLRYRHCPFSQICGATNTLPVVRLLFMSAVVKLARWAMTSNLSCYRPPRNTTVLEHKCTIDNKKLVSNTHQQP